MKIESELIHGDAIDDETAVSPPIYYSATFRAESAEMFAEMANVPQHQKFYTRYGNPLHARVVKIMAALEGAENGLVTASGMGAISSTLLALVKQGDHIVAQKSHYMGTAKIITEMLARFGVESTFVDQTDVKAFEDALRPSTKLIITETPSNPILTITDLKAVAELAKARGILTMCDNTFASPINQNPIKLGIDIVVHSATKYLGGHHDITAGVILSSQKNIDRIWPAMITLGPTLSPMDAWLLLRSLRTLSVRVEKQNENALALANFLIEQPRVEKVFYPGLSSHPQYELAKEQMRGHGGVVSFLYKGSYAETAKFVGNLKIPTNAVSLGGVETLLVHVASMWAGSMNDAQMKTANIAPSLVRVSVGLEHREDLIRDFAEALK